MSITRTEIKTVSVAALTTALLLLSSPSNAHPATEKYIPIGYWSSVNDSQNYYRGTTSDARPRGRSIAAVHGGRSVNIEVDDDTKIWIDRSHLGKKSLVGTLADITPGSEIEVRYAGPQGGVAKWIKVRPK